MEELKTGVTQERGGRISRKVVLKAKFEAG